MTRVLILDDNPFDSELVLRQLMRSGIEFSNSIVNSKKTYLEELEAFEPDVVFCDFHIAHDFTAVEAVRILKADHPEISFVLVTGTMNEEVANICIGENMDDFVLKSNMKRLPLTLINAIEKRKILLQKKETFDKLVESENRIRDFASHMQNAIEEERARIARELHDELGQQLSGLKMNLAMFRNQGTEAENSLKEMAGTLEDCISTVKKITSELRPSILDTFGLAPAMEWLCKEFQKNSGVKCICKISVNEEHIPTEIATCFFRVCQEALTNVLKHSQASSVKVLLLDSKNSLFLEVADNGIGISSEKPGTPFSFGLTSMRERANIIGAEFEILSKPGKGTSINLTKQLLK